MSVIPIKYVYTNLEASTLPITPPMQFTLILIIFWSLQRPAAGQVRGLISNNQSLSGSVQHNNNFPGVLVNKNELI